MIVEFYNLISPGPSFGVASCPSGKQRWAGGFFLRLQ